MLKKSVLSLALCAAATAANAEVLTTIKPLGFIANAITDGITDTKVLLPANASPHDYSLKPSDVETLNNAKLVVWIGEGMEGFLEKSLDRLPKERVLTLDEVPAIAALVEKTRKDDHDEHHHDHEHSHDHKHEHKHDHGHSHDHKHDDHKHEHHAHDHKHDHEHHDHDHHGHSHDKDWHIWLSSDASLVIAEQIADRLGAQFPEQKAKIADNLSKFKVDVAAKQADIAKQLAPVKEKGYYTFHEAYGYFEEAYGLKSLGSFTINPTVAPGAKTLAAIKKNIQANNAVCLFAEPQFTPKVIETLSKNTNVKVGQLDPLGAKIKLERAAYPAFLQSLADDFTACLGK